MDRRQNLGLLLILALMAGSGWLLLRDQPLSGLLEALGQVRPGYVVLGLGLMLCFVGCEAMCSKLILGRLGHRLSYRQCLGYSFVGFYVSSITPSSTGGQPAQIYYMSRGGVPAAHGSLNMLLIAVCYQVTALGCAVAAFLLLPGVRAGLERQMAEYRRGADCLRANLGLLPALLGLTLLQLTCLYAVPYTVYLGFGLRGASLFQVAGTQALVSMAVGLLPLPGAVGAAEGSALRAFALFFGPGLVAPAVLLSRGISFYSFLLLSAGVTLWVHLRTRGRTAPARPKTAACGKVRGAAAPPMGRKISSQIS